MKRILPVLAALSVLAPVLSSACQICVPFPKKSAADHLINAELVVLAREDPDRPFHLKAIELLKGRADPLARVGEIDLFLDSTTRRILRLHPEWSVLVAYGEFDGKTEWRRIGLADADLAPVAKEIVRLAPAWERDAGLRLAYFAKRLGHENPQVSSLAHLEVGRSAYREIRAIKNPLSREQMRSFLANFRYLEWHSLYILLLAQTGHPADRKLITRSFHSASSSGLTTNLAAWATAMIEIDGAAAVELIEREYFSDRGRSRRQEELEAILLALSVHGTGGRTQLRDRIVASYGLLLERDPSMTPEVARDLIAWQRREYAQQIGSYVAANPRATDFKTTLQLRAYGRQAAQPADRQIRAPGGGGTSD